MKDKPVYATIDQLKQLLQQIDPSLRVIHAIGQKVEELTITAPSARGRVLNLYTKVERPGIFYTGTWKGRYGLVFSVSGSPIEEKEWLSKYIPIEETLQTLVKCLKGEMRF